MVIEAMMQSMQSLQPKLSSDLAVAGYGGQPSPFSLSGWLAGIERGHDYQRVMEVGCSLVVGFRLGLEILRPVIVRI
jgi:hypothetical protein